MLENIQPGLTDLGIALMIILILIRDLLVPLIKPDPVEKLVQRIDSMLQVWRENQHKLDDMHRWMSPNDHGQQTWKDHAPVHGLRDSIGKLFSVINDNFMDVKDMLERLLKRSG